MGSCRRATVIAPLLAAVLAVSGSALGIGTASASSLGGLLARPHPKFVDGKTNGSSYALLKHIYATSYWTERPDGSGRYPANSVSGYQVPSSAYPHGYAVTVKGAFVVSGTNDELLLIASAPNAKTISLVIKPATPVA